MKDRACHLDSPPSARVLKRLKQKQPTEVALGIGSNWWEASLDFLGQCPFITELRAVSHTFGDIQGISRLRRLRTLRLHTYAKGPLDFGRLVQLRDATIEWNSGYTGLEQCKRLRKLIVHRPSEEAISQLAALSSLKHLELVNAWCKTVWPIWQLQALTSLRLALIPSLDSRMLAGLSRLRRINTLEIESCNRLRSIAFVSKCKRLRRLVLEDCKNIESVEPLRALRSLSEAWLGGSNFRNGRLDAILDLPELTECSLANRRHFRPSASEVMTAIHTRSARG